MNKFKNLIENILYKYNYRPCKNCICFHCNDYHSCYDGCKYCKNKSNNRKKCFEYRPIADNDIPTNFFLGIIILIIVLLFL